jgi:hypothetical protein
MRTFSPQQLATMECGASHEVEELTREVRRLYAAEDSRAQMDAAMYAMFAGAHQHLQAELRTIEAALRMLAPPQPAIEEPQGKRMPPMMGGGSTNQ